MIRRTIITLLLLLSIIPLISWLSTEPPRINISSLISSTNNIINWNSLVWIWGYCYANPDSGLQKGQVFYKESTDTNWYQIGSDITEDKDSDTQLVPWTNFKQGSLYSIKIYAIDNAGNDTTLIYPYTIEVTTNSSVGTVTPIIGSMQ